MNADRPLDGTGEDAPQPTKAVTPEPTEVIPQLEPTEVLPAAAPQGPAAGDSWASGPSPWAPPPGDPIPPAPPAFPPFNPGGSAYPQAGYTQPGPYWQGQQGAYQGAQGFVGQQGSYGWQQPGGAPGNWTAAPPQPLTGFPPPAGPPRGGRGWVVALVTVAAVLVVSLIAALAVPLLTQLPNRHGGSATPSASGGPTTKPSGSPSPRSSPTSKPTATMPSNPTDVLKKNPVYALRVPAKCPYQSMPGSQAAFRKQVGKLVDCENAAWKKALAPTAVEFSKPKVKFYSTSAKSPCGRLGTTFPASYCTGDSTLYFSLQSYVQGRYFRLSVAQFVMHEYAHHVQNLADIFESSDAMDESSAVITRRIELQAHCMAHYALKVSGLGYTALDNREIEYQWGYTTDPTGHGSTKAEAFWGRRGLNAKTIAACNTWTVKASRVK